MVPKDPNGTGYKGAVSPVKSFVLNSLYSKTQLDNIILSLNYSLHTPRSLVRHYDTQQPT